MPNMPKLKLKFAPLLLALALLGVSLSPTPAHAVEPEIWAAQWEWDGPGTGQIDAEASYLQVLDCNTAITVEVRTDRASRFTRDEDSWPSPSSYAAYPANQRIVTVHDVSDRDGWTMFYSWTYQSEHLDLMRVGFVPDCDADLNPNT